MGEAHVVRRFEVSAQVLWSYLSWRGMERLAGSSLFAAVEFETQEVAVGAIKTMHLQFGLPIRERLEWLDTNGFGYGYRILDVGSLPVADYEGSVRVTACGPDASVAVIRCRFVGVTVADDAWAEEWKVMESGVLASVAAHVERLPRHG